MIIFTFTLFLIPLVTNSEQNGCGCELNRNDKTKLKKGSVFSDEENALEQCPLIENDIEEISPDKKYVKDRMVLIPSGEYQVGTNDIAIEGDHEGPKRIVKLKSFYLDKYEVSNRDYESFINATKYKTETENFGDSFVFSLFLNKTFKEQLKDYRVVQAVWWYKVLGANWNHPYGPDSNISEIREHPVTHVTWNDAKAYCRWRSARLPTEAEWEAACRGGHRDTKYPWGDKLLPGKKHMSNIWQGTFPTHNSARDGYVGTSPIDMFPPNDFGLYNMAGNVWEWTEDSWSKTNPEQKLKKGGSYLCHHSYCYRYRCSARSQNTEDSSAGNLGFRCAKSV